MTWPVAAQLGRAIPGGGDALVHLWTFNWVKQALLTEANLYYTYWLYYPEGVSLLTHNFAWLHIALWLPLQVVVGEVAAYSVVFLLTIAVNGWAMYLLARDLLESEMAALGAGVVVAFWPYIMSHSSHPNGILIAPLIFSLLFIRRLLVNGRGQDLWLTALCLALIGLGRWQHLVIGGFILAAYTFYYLLLGKALLATNLKRLLAAGCLSLVLMSPFLVPVVYYQATRTHPEDLFFADSRETDLLTYWIPARGHPLWGDAVRGLYGWLDLAETSFEPFLGYTVFLLALYGLARQRQQTVLWGGLALWTMVLALGPTLRIKGTVYNVPMPYDWIDDFFLIELVRRAERFNYVLGIPVAMMVGWGLVRLQQRWVRWGTVVTALLCLLIVGEYAVMMPTQTLSVPAWSQRLAAEAESFGTLDIPMNPRAMTDKMYMAYQLSHQKPMVSGHVSRLPREAIAFIERVPLLQAVRQTEGLKAPSLVDISHQLRQLAAVDVRYLVLHKPLLGQEQLDEWRAWLGIAPYYEDDLVLVYTTSPVLKRDFVMAQPILMDGRQRPLLGLVEATVSPGEMGQEGLLTVDTRWAGAAVMELDYNRCIELIDDEGVVAQTHCRPLSKVWPTSQWQANALVDPPPYEFQVSPYLRAGVYDVGVTVADGAQVVGETAVVGQVMIEAIERVFTPPTPAMETNILWEEVIYLTGYDLEMDEAQLNIRFYWQAQARMDHYYKFFVHLTDEATGQLVAQADNVPGNWHYPTIWWEADEYVTDNLSLSLMDVPAGSYQLLVGWYDADDGRRLVPMPTAANNSVPLTTITR